MKRILPMLLLAVSLGATCQTGEKNFIDQPYIEITGKAEMEVSPDLFNIRIIISEEDSKNKISVAEQEQKMVQVLEKMDIDVNKDLLVKDITSEFKKYIIAGKEIILHKEYLLILRDPSLVPRTFTELEKTGISNIVIMSAESSHFAELRKEVRINAIKAAKEKAKYLSEAIDQETGKALYIQEINQDFLPRYSNTILMRAKIADDSDEAVFEFEKIKIEYSVLCRFELK